MDGAEEDESGEALIGFVVGVAQLPQTIVVEPLVGQQRLHVHAIDQVGCGDAVVALSRQKNKAGKVSQSIDEGDGPCCQSNARAPGGLMASPPFCAPMPC
jgi:hypothetical protein